MPEAQCSGSCGEEGGGLWGMTWQEEPRDLAEGDLTRFALCKHHAGSWWGGRRRQNAGLVSLTHSRHRPTGHAVPTDCTGYYTSDTLQSNSK